MTTDEIKNEIYKSNTLRVKSAMVKQKVYFLIAIY